jgi:hypothetical protein
MGAPIGANYKTFLYRSKDGMIKDFKLQILISVVVLKKRRNEHKNTTSSFLYNNLKLKKNGRR